MKETMEEQILHKTESHLYSAHTIAYAATEELPLYAHWHREMEFFYLAEGCLELWVDEQVYALQAGEGIFLPPNCFHFAKNPSHTAGIFRALVIAPEEILGTRVGTSMDRYIMPVTRSTGVKAYVLSNDNEAGKGILEKLLQVLDNAADAEKELLVAGYLLLIWQELYELHISQYEINGTVARKYNQLEEAFELIHNHYDEELTIGDLAKSVHLSVAQFIRIFKACTGMTPFSYLNRYRIMKSCSLLSNTDKSISDIALMCGFRNLSYFNREFKKIMVVTPSRYRRTMDR